MPVAIYLNTQEKTLKVQITDLQHQIEKLEPEVKSGQEKLAKKGEEIKLTAKQLRALS